MNTGGGNLTYVDRGSVMRYQCDGFCSSDPKNNNDFSTEIWFDNPSTLTSKYELATQYNLKGVGMWEATDVDYTANGLDEAMAMWDPIAN